jgi:glycosyltransferase involved in cell wall biosynthesis
LSGWKAAAVEKKKRRKFAAWLESLNSHPPDVLVGANIDVNGGIRHHLLGIQRYSSLRVELAPSDKLLESLTYHDFHTTLRKPFFDFVPIGIRAIHSHVFPYFIQWSRAQKDSGLFWVHTYHLPYFPEHARGDLTPWQEEINYVLINDARHADVRISTSEWQQRYLEETHGIETVYIPGGVDLSLCDRGDPMRFIEKTGVDRFVLWVGRNDPVKNPGDFVRLAQRLPDQTFIMVGKDLSPESLKTEWDLVAPRNLIFMSDMSRMEVQDALAACSALVVTSKREGLPTLVLEGMAHGKPVVVPDEPGCMEAIGNEEAGFIYRRNDLNDLMNVTLAALADAGRGLRARQRVLAEYDWRVVAPKLDDIYRGSPV